MAKEQSKKKVYTAGYYGRDMNEFKETVDKLGALLVDIRLVPQSRFTPEWRKKNLETRFGENYLHVKELGNKGFKEKRVEISDLDTGLAIVEAIDRDLVMLCACKYIDRCHRRQVAEELRARGYEVTELK